MPDFRNLNFSLSFLAANDPASLLWRQQFIKTYLEQDFPQLGIRIPAPTLYRFLQIMPDWSESFYRTQSGNELDLVLEQGSRRFAFEFKLSAAPKISEGFWRAIEDLQTQNAWVVAPVEKPYQLAKNVMVTNLAS